MINGVSFVPRRVITGAQGEVRHLLKRTDPEFDADTLPFGEVYASIVFPDQIKDWKLHARSTSRLAVLSGVIEFALSDQREDSSTFQQLERITVGEGQYGLLVVPAGVAATWRNVSEGNTTIINISTLPHDPEESRVIPFEEIPFSWE